MVRIKVCYSFKNKLKCFQRLLVISQKEVKRFSPISFNENSFQASTIWCCLFLLGFFKSIFRNCKCSPTGCSFYSSIIFLSLKACLSILKLFRFYQTNDCLWLLLKRELIKKHGTLVFFPNLSFGIFSFFVTLSCVSLWKKNWKKISFSFSLP